MYPQIPPWLERALDFAHKPVLGRRLTVLLDEHPVGSIAFHLAEPLAQAVPNVMATEDTVTLGAPFDQTLAAVAHWLQVQGHCGAWRNELLPVVNHSNKVLSHIERAAVRPLALRTQAVHLVAYVDIGKNTPMVWLQQRAKTKSTDPGLWDTLAGGLVSAGEASLEAALAREAWEEAGVRLPAPELQLERGYTLREHRPLNNVSYMVEDLMVWDVTLPQDFAPVNQDGEVDGFACKHWSQVMIMIEQGEVTLEAALTIAASGARRGLLYPRARDALLKLRVADSQ